MKVAILIDALGRGGAERQALNATWTPARRACDIELISYSPDDQALPTYDHPAFRECRVSRLPRSRSLPGLVYGLTRLFRPCGQAGPYISAPGRLPRGVLRAGSHPSRAPAPEKPAAGYGSSTPGRLPIRWFAH